MNTQKVLDLAIQIQQIPAPTFEEAERAKFVLEMFRQEALTDLQTDSSGNVLARLPGQGKAPPLIVSAHLDTVFPSWTSLDIHRENGRVYGPGIGDNSMGVAGLFGILWGLRQKGIPSLPGDLWLVANTGEEGLGDLKGMKAICDRFGEKVKAYLALEGMAFGHIYYKAIGVRRYKITAHTGGGHSWTDYGRPSAIHELSGLVMQLTRQNLPTSPRTTMNVGRMSGGTSINTIAAQAWLELDLRSEGTEALARLARDTETIIEAASKPGVTMQVEVIGERPAGEIAQDHPIIKTAQNALYHLGIEPGMTTGSTDANIPLSRGYPALVLGLTSGGGAHTLHEYIETDPLESGLAHLHDFVTNVW
jgi:acetylornithine deacetylase/succinyl-diaminopimelate desuccinylase-like protein